MTPELFLVHILAFHLAVPEPVSFSLRPLWPVPHCAQIIRNGPVGIPKSWSIQYDSVCWDRYPGIRTRVVAHEACHAAYDHQVEDWGQLAYGERDYRHDKIGQCVNRILRDCVVHRLGTVLDEHPKNERRLRLRAELQELLEREGNE